MTFEISSPELASWRVGEPRLGTQISRHDFMENVVNEASRYCASLFSPMEQSDLDDQTGYAVTMRQLADLQYDIWEYSVMNAAEPCPRNKTIGWDHLTTKLWTLAMQTNADLAVAVAWTMNKRFMNIKEQNHVHWTTVPNETLKNVYKQHGEAPEARKPKTVDGDVESCSGGQCGTCSHPRATTAADRHSKTRTCRTCRPCPDTHVSGGGGERWGKGGWIGGLVGGREVRGSVRARISAVCGVTCRPTCSRARWTSARWAASSAPSAWRA